MPEPLIKNVNARIGFLERKTEHLTRKIEQRRGSDRSLSFDQEELSAVEAGIKALRRFRAEDDGTIDAALLALSELVDAAASDDAQRIGNAIRRARAALEDCA